jgi:hypothetical protein
MKLESAIDKVELKFTALPDDEQAVRDFLKDRDSKDREVFFYETQPRRLGGRGIVLRVRKDAGKHKSTVKIRPSAPGVAIAAWCSDNDVEIELDKVADEPAWSVKLDHDCDPDDPFAPAQRRLIDVFTPGVEWNTIKRLGPVKAKVWELKNLDGLDHKLAAESWKVDGFHFIELSIKVDPDEADAAQAAFRTFLGTLVDDVDGDRSRKTERVLELLAGE